MNRIYNLNDHYFDVIDTEAKAYFLGFIFADGTNYPNGVIKLDLTEEDSYILESLKNELGYEGSVKHYAPQVKMINGKPYNCNGTARLQFRSKIMSERLSNLGCVCNKSYCEHHLLPYSVIPENLYNHYVRGYFDGNGCISYHDAGYKTGTQKFGMSFCGQENMIHDISLFIGGKFNCHPAETSRYPDRDNHNIQTEICGNLLICKIMDWLYQDATLYLKRKHDKYLFLIEHNKKVYENRDKYGSCHPRRSVIYLSTLTVFESLTEAEKCTGINRSTICVNCKGKKDLFMYTDEYNALKEV